MDSTNPISILHETIEIFYEGSWDERAVGKYDSVMWLFDGVNDSSGWIEWEIPELDEYVEIGLIFEHRNGQRALIDYDGVMSLSPMAIRLLEQADVIVDEIFKPGAP
jgi:hypothetical protein